MPDERLIDTEIIHRIVVEEGRMKNPYSELHTLVEKVTALKPYLVSVARSDPPKTTYGKTREECGIFTGRQGRVLGILGLHEDELENPLLSAVVVQSNGDNSMPGDKYFRMVERAQNTTEQIPSTSDGRRQMWRNHLDEVQNYWRQ